MSSPERYLVWSREYFNDPYFLQLEPNIQHIYLYLITNHRMDISGIYYCPIDIIKAETGRSKQIIKKALSQFEKEDRIYYHEGFIAIPVIPLWQNPNKEAKKHLEKIFKNYLNFTQVLIKKSENFNRVLKKYSININELILLQVPLEVPQQGNLEGTQTHSNTSKHIQTTTNSINNQPIFNNQHNDINPEEVNKAVKNLEKKMDFNKKKRKEPESYDKSYIKKYAITAVTNPLLFKSQIELFRKQGKYKLVELILQEAKKYEQETNDDSAIPF